MRSKESWLTDLTGKITPAYKEPQITTKIVSETIDIKLEKLPQSFENFKICHLSDFHNVQLFETNPLLLENISQKKPDIVLISGDSINDQSMDNAINNIEHLKTIIDAKNIFLVSGNHDFMQKNQFYKPKILEFHQEIKKHGINFLRNESLEITRENESIFILGIDDPHGYKDENKYIQYQLQELTKAIPENKLKILISHRPEKIETYSDFNIDLVFSGHAHGGQIKIPVINRGLIAPHKGFFAKYIDGQYQHQQTQEIVNPGVSNEYKIPRLNNPGKIFMVKLNQKN